MATHAGVKAKEMKAMVANKADKTWGKTMMVSIKNMRNIARKKMKGVGEPEYSLFVGVAPELSASLIFLRSPPSRPSFLIACNPISALPTL